MLKRLTITVLILGLIVAFGGTAFAGYGTRDLTKGAPEEGPALPMTDRATYPDLSAPDGHLSRGTLKVMGEDLPYPQATSPEHGCEILDYCPYEGNMAYYWLDLENDRVELGSLYDNRENHEATVYGIAARIYEVSGTVDLHLKVYADGGGEPGALLLWDTIPNAELGIAYPGCYCMFEFSTPVDVGYGGYYISLGTDSSGADGDYIGIGHWNQDGVDNLRGVAYDPVAEEWIGLTEFWGYEGYVFNLRGAVDVCYSESFCRNVQLVAGAYPIPMPSTDAYWGWGGGDLVGFAQAFMSEVPETLHWIHVQHLNSTAYGEPATSYDATSTNGFVCELWPDDGGLPDVSGSPIASRTLTGLAQVYPHTGNATTWEGSAWDTLYFDFETGVDALPVMEGPWHMTLTPTTTVMANGWIYPGCPVADFGGLSVLWADSAWADSDTDDLFVASGYAGAGASSLKLWALLCQDEYPECVAPALYDHEHIWHWKLDTWSDTSVTAGDSYIGAIAQKFTANEQNRLDVVRVQIDGGTLHPTPASTPSLGIRIHTDGMPGPGAVIWDTLVTNPVFEPGWNEVVIPDFPGVYPVWNFYLSIYAVYDDADDVIRGLSEDDFVAHEHVMQGDGLWLYDAEYQEWLGLNAEYGYIDNAMFSAEYCMVPLQIWTCVEPGTVDEWTTVNRDYARTGHSGVELTDAWCDLNLYWSWEHPLWGTINGAGPLIYDDKVVQAFSSGTQGGYYMFDLNPGDPEAAAPIDSITAAVFGSMIGGNIRCTPTIDNDVLYVAGGTAASVSAYDWTAVGTGLTMTDTVWTATPANTAGGFELSDYIRYGNFIVLDGVVYFTDDGAKIYAANASDGQPYSGWTEPYQMIGPALRSGCTDGTNLYYSVFNTGSEGDVIAIAAANGTLVWSLAAGDGLMAEVEYGDDYTDGSEVFNCAISYDDGQLFTSSNSFINASPLQEEGIFYILSSSDGSIENYALSQQTLNTCPIIDGDYVFLLTNYSYGTPIHGGAILAFNRGTGIADYGLEPPPVPGDARNRVLFDGAMTCEETVAPDLLIAFSGDGNDEAYLSVFETGLNPNELFHRRIDHGAGANGGGSVSIGTDSDGDVHVLATDTWGTLYDLKKGVDRPRLEIIDWYPAVAVPFGSPDDTLITFENVYFNSGCAELVVSLRADDTQNSTTPGAAPGLTVVRDEFATAASSLADQLTLASSDLKTMHKVATDVRVLSDEVEDVRAEAGRTFTNKAALAVPSFLIENGTYAGDVFDPPGGGFTVAGGDSADINVRVVGSQIPRGPQNFYIEFFEHNDPDYFLNVNDSGPTQSRPPQIRASLVGGCLLDSTYLHFGVGGANWQIVYNSGRLGTGPLDNLSIDALTRMNYQGLYFYGVTRQRFALESQDWWSGGGEVNGWWSIQADPNDIDTTCKPALEEDVLLNMIWDPVGEDYVELRGNRTHRIYVDSVQNFWDSAAGEWNFDLYKEAPFDNDSTMGLITHARQVGFLDVTTYPLLNNAWVDIMEVTERNDREMPNWKFGAYFDHDFYADDAANEESAFDTMSIDRSVSAAWTWPGPANSSPIQAGYIKLPFGCGYDPIKNVIPIEHAQYMNFQGTPRHYWDSSYFYMSQDTGMPYGHDMETGNDQGAIYTYMEHDFAPSETITFAVAHFAFDGITEVTTSADKIAPLAHLLNKAAGFGRGDLNGDNVVGLADICMLYEFLYDAEPAPIIPFDYLGDVDGTPGYSQGDYEYLIDYYFNDGPCPMGDWVL